MLVCISFGEQYEPHRDRHLSTKKAPCTAEQIQASGFSGLSCVSLTGGFVVQLQNYGIAAQFSGKREGPAGLLTLLF